MKYISRAKETPFIKKQMVKLGIKTVQFPRTEVFEGQGESKWFLEGKLLVLGYGYRSTANTVKLLQHILDRIYSSYNVYPPLVLGVKMAHPNFYHLDIALCPISENCCLLHEGSITSTKKLEKFIDVVVMKTTDPFALNMVVMPTKIITHKLKYPRDKQFIEKHTHKPVVEVDVSEFEKSGGSVSCMTFKLFG
jgi:N-dimethylarginine dimethylaminohydrolase